MPALVNGVWPMSPFVAHPLLLPVPFSQEYPIIYDPKAAPASSIVIGLVLVRLVLSANAYSVKLVGAANPFAVSPPDQLTNDSEPPLCVRPSWSYAVPTDDDVNVAVVLVRPYVVRVAAGQAAGTAQPAKLILGVPLPS